MVVWKGREGEGGEEERGGGRGEGGKGGREREGERKGEKKSRKVHVVDNGKMTDVLLILGT